MLWTECPAYCDLLKPNGNHPAEGLGHPLKVEARVRIPLGLQRFGWSVAHSGLGSGPWRARLLLKRFASERMNAVLFRFMLDSVTPVGA